MDDSHDVQSTVQRVFRLNANNDFDGGKRADRSAAVSIELYM